ncbi:unnamed protein product [Parascedosporium putredinis]|uniref:Ribosomal protein L13 n=1 Tax=Parascedosporium putredinis TaxID=1442378 RepID=A0A9P1HCC6_9PEZI|nr:unnamed protein product [Parascedosporium putredinis]CAI8002944.1 unnamed protein product [Parascedosporium putredinis]
MSQVIGPTQLAYSRVWHQVSAKALHPTLSTQNGTTPPSLGRLASRIAVLLMGKHKPMWDPSTDCGDYVVTYYRHNTRPGSLKAVTMDVLMDKFGGSEILRRAVSGMLPKNRLRDKRLARLKAFDGAAHPYKKNVIKVGDKTVGEEGWREVAKAIRASSDARI